MSFPIRAFFVVLVTVFGSCVDVRAQTRPSRVLSAGWGDGLTIGNSLITARGSGISVTTAPAGGGYAASALGTAVEVMGAYDVFGTSYVTSMLVAGGSTQGGRVEYWVLNGSAWTLSSSLVVPGSDFTGVAQVGPCLYLLDCVTNTVLRGLWHPSSSLGSVSLSVYATATQFPFLAGASRMQMYGVDAGESGATQPGVFVFNTLELGAMKWGYFLTDNGSNGVSVSEFNYGTMPAMSVVVARDDLVKAGDSSILVAARASQSFEVVDSLDAVIGSGVGTPQVGDVLTQLSQPLVAGERYTARVIGQSFGTTFVPIHRNGFPEQFNDGSKLSRIVIAPEDCRAGNAQFSISSSIVRPGVWGPARTYFGAMTLGLSDTPIVPFDNGQGMNELLVATYWVGALGQISLNAMQGYVEMGFPIPAGPAWEGIVMHGQFIVFDDSVFRLSEVVGWKIFSAQ